MPSNLDLAAFIESALHITSEVPRDRILQVLLLHIADEFTDAFTRHGGTVFHRYDLNHKLLVPIILVNTRLRLL